MYVVPILSFLLRNPAAVAGLVSLAGKVGSPNARFLHSAMAGPDAHEAVRLLPLLMQMAPLITTGVRLFDAGAARGNASSTPDVEYFSIGKIVKSIGKVLAPVAQIAAPIVGGIVGGPAGAAVGSMIGGLVGGAAGAEQKVPAQGASAGLVTPSGTTLLQTATPEINSLARNALVMARTSGPESAFMYLVTSVPQMRQVVQEMRNLRAQAFFDDDPRAQCSMHGRLEVLKDEELVGGNQLSTPASFGRPGTFYKSSLVQARLVDDLASGVYGQIEFADLPYKISIARRSGQGRARIALAHELAHLANRVYKLGLNHDKVHALGVFYASEGQKILNALPV